MLKEPKLYLFMVIASSIVTLIKCEPDWTFEFVSMTLENQTPDIIFIDLKVIQPSRGITALNGSVHFKEDLTDDLLFSASSYYSTTGSGFLKSPYSIPKGALSANMNIYYKDMIMDALKNCTENAPWTENKFVSPCTKRFIKVNNCIISNENMPSKLRSGYYKMIMEYSKQAQGTMEIIIKVEPK